MGTNETVGRRVRVNLTLRGLSTLELAEFLGITRNAANRRLSGASAFSAADLAAVAEWLDIPISDLFEPLPEQPVFIESVA
ncbi:helix-turn-helix transcriptional regulator [Propionimicrobium lymphophilum]|uniref:helix-turn-helix transcriptional regulator n=1 Tax=Propionimicrobium lymphophilum TaxID=33012 RepID=UPI003EC6E659